MSYGHGAAGLARNHPHVGQEAFLSVYITGSIARQYDPFANPLMEHKPGGTTSSWSAPSQPILSLHAVSMGREYNDLSYYVASADTPLRRTSKSGLISRHFSSKPSRHCRAVLRQWRDLLPLDSDLVCRVEGYLLAVELDIPATGPLLKTCFKEALDLPDTRCQL